MKQNIGGGLAGAELSRGEVARSLGNTLKGCSKYDSYDSVSLHSSSSDMFRYIYMNLRKIPVLRKLSKNIL